MVGLRAEARGGDLRVGQGASLEDQEAVLMEAGQ